MATGLAWQAGSGTVKDSLGGSGNSDVGEWPLGVGGVSSLVRYSTDAGPKHEVANRDPTGLGAAAPWRGRAHGWEG